MSRSMTTLARGLRGGVVAPAAIAIAVVVGADSAVGIALVALAAVMFETSAVGFLPAAVPAAAHRQRCPDPATH